MRQVQETVQTRRQSICVVYVATQEHTATSKLLPNRAESKPSTRRSFPATDATDRHTGRSMQRSLPSSAASVHAFSSVQLAAVVSNSHFGAVQNRGGPNCKVS